MLMGWEERSTKQHPCGCKEVTYSHDFFNTDQVQYEICNACAKKRQEKQEQREKEQAEKERQTCKNTPSKLSNKELRSMYLASLKYINARIEDGTLHTPNPKLS
jgi:hypothetical protein